MVQSALEILLGLPCYHMFEALAHHEHHPSWLAAAAGDAGALSGVLDAYGATVDWPGCSLWRELMGSYPEAKVLLTVRPADLWWESYADTIHQLMLQPIPDAAEVGPELAGLSVFGHTLTKRSFDAPYEQQTPPDLMAAYERHNDAVRTGVPADRLLESTSPRGGSPCASSSSWPYLTGRFRASTIAGPSVSSSASTPRRMSLSGPAPRTSSRATSEPPCRTRAWTAPERVSTVLIDRWSVSVRSTTIKHMTCISA